MTTRMQGQQGQVMARCMRSVLIWGESMAGKSTYLVELIRMVCLPQRKRARVYVGDGSLATYLESGLIERGVLEVLDYSAYDWPLSTSQQITQGYWPEGGVPGARLVPPTEQDLQEIGCWGFEGLSVMAQYIMGAKRGGLADQGSRGIKIGQDSPIQIQDAEVASWTTDKNGNRTPIYKAGTGTGLTFGGNPMSHFSVAQRYMTQAIEHSKGLPGWVVWTAHERMAQEKLGGTEKGGDLTLGEKMIGPEVAGNAMTPIVSRMFADTLHATVAKAGNTAPDAMTKKQVKVDAMEYRLYTRNHYDPDGVVQLTYRAGMRTPAPHLVQPYYVGSRPGEAIRACYLDLAKARQDYQARLDAELEAYQQEDDKAHG